MGILGIIAATLVCTVLALVVLAWTAAALKERSQRKRTRLGILFDEHDQAVKKVRDLTSRHNQLETRVRDLERGAITRSDLAVLIDRRRLRGFRTPVPEPDADRAAAGRVGAEIAREVSDKGGGK